MKTKILALLLSLMIGGITINAQDQKGQQHSTPAKMEKCPMMKDQASSSCCGEMKDMKSCQGMDQHKTTSTKMDNSKKTNKETAAAVYTCPMHPEVQSDKPGKCPKCGMDLVKRK